jgi:hypothetical protein
VLAAVLCGRWVGVVHLYPTTRARARACRRALADQFHLHTTLLTWVGVGMVLVITWTYMSIALKLPKE